MFIWSFVDFQYDLILGSAIFEVDFRGFMNCNISSGSLKGIGGNTSVTLTTTGRFYFISFRTDCNLGMHLLVNVSWGKVRAEFEIMLGIIALLKQLHIVWIRFIRFQHLVLNLIHIINLVSHWCKTMIRIIFLCAFVSELLFAHVEFGMQLCNICNMFVLNSFVLCTLALQKIKKLYVYMPLVQKKFKTCKQAHQIMTCNHIITNYNLLIGLPKWINLPK